MSRRRGRHDPLQPVNEFRWLVLRNQLSQIDWSQQLLPKTDLKEALTAGRQRLIDEGCKMDDLSWLAFIFGWRDGKRICLEINAIAPGSSTVGHGTYLGGNAPRR